MLGAVAGKPPAKGAPKPKLLYFEAEPAAWTRLSEEAEEKAKPLLSLLDARIAWPGKPGVPPPPVIRPLNAAEQNLFELGKQTYTTLCAACHQPNGTGNAALCAPPIVNDKVVLVPKQHQIDVILYGQTNGVVQKAEGGGKMPSWKQLSDVEIASVVSYTRNSWGNKASENVVQPSEVKAERK